MHEVNVVLTGVDDPLQLDNQEKRDEPDQTLRPGQIGVYPQLLLFGDSITQQATLTLQPRMQTLYIRRADVLNRGYSGYTTKLALTTLPHFLPPSTPGPSLIQPLIRLAVVFFGANDACLPGYAQHVPLPLYIANLRRITEYQVFKRHETKLILITPGPINEWQLGEPVTRTAANAKRYAEAVKQLAKETQIPCVDIWTAFMKLAGYKASETSDTRQALHSSTAESNTSPQTQQAHTGLDADGEATLEQPALPGSHDAPPNLILPRLLLDGLHFTPQGYDILFNELMATIRREVPECAPEQLPMPLREWRDILNVPKAADRATARPEDDSTTDAKLQIEAETERQVRDGDQDHSEPETEMQEERNTSVGTPESWTDVEAEMKTEPEADFEPAAMG